MRRWRPDRLAARFALLLTAALLAANLAALGLLALERDRLEGRARDEAVLARLLAVAPLMDGAADATRARLAEGLSRRGLRVRIDDRPAVAPDAGDRRTRRLRTRVEAALEGRALRLAPASARGGPAASLALSDPPGWLNATWRGGPPPRRGEAWPVVLLLALGLAATLAVGLAFVRQLTRPLGALAAAARAAGRGDRAVRVPEDGARELREAAAAFNDMQARIARADAERMRLVAALGHDLRTPITSLRIRAEMLEEAGGETGAEAAAMGDTLREMEVMADGLLAFARGEGEAEAPERIDLAPWLGRLAAARGAAVGDMAAVAAQARPVALGRAVGNLVDNALRYAGGATLRLDREGAEAVIAVEDDGPGIPPERLGEMTEPFRRGEASRGRDTGGAGLGLAIARAVAEAHGGALRLRNRAGGGLAAEIRLPAEADGA
ncbi:HAMP domain-containing protein [Jannaschia sp. Os4]|uniref:ATP-binding protein n=1 Tax=Jannaschia sp. Os4 TaxID=2807617 RepID=UPI00193A4FE4|nr:ATP-binding protein [Jannaschia sp. Os4]MBM2576356.1 HAMP domain-containing protein [Jannaschia sp. Os4]